MLFSKKKWILPLFAIIMVVSVFIFKKMNKQEIRHLEGNPEVWYMIGSPEVMLEIANNRFLLTGSGYLYENMVTALGYDEGDWYLDDAHKYWKGYRAEGKPENLYLMEEGIIVIYDEEGYQGKEQVTFLPNLAVSMGYRFIKEPISLPK